MALTDTVVRQVKHTGKAAGDKHADGGGMYLLVKAGGKYWRMDYAYAGKRKTLALGVYPEVSLADARDRRTDARKLLAKDIDPGAAKRQEKLARAEAAANTFEAVARDWLQKTAADRMASTQGKVTTWLEKDVFPYIGKVPISNIAPRAVLPLLLARDLDWSSPVCSSDLPSTTASDTHVSAFACALARPRRQQHWLAAP